MTFKRFSRWRSETARLRRAGVKAKERPSHQPAQAPEHPKRRDCRANANNQPQAPALKPHRLRQRRRRQYDKEADDERHQKGVQDLRGDIRIVARTIAALAEEHRR